MIHIVTVRGGLLVVAIMVNDHYEITTARGLTVRYAESRLIRKVT